MESSNLIHRKSQNARLGPSGAADSALLPFLFSLPTPSPTPATGGLLPPQGLCPYSPSGRRTPPERAT